jgi:alkaline phosphatase D
MCGRSPDGLDRRAFLRRVAASSVGGGLAAVLADRDILRPVRAREDGPDPPAGEAGDPAETFPGSVMSGGPTESGVILWTRIAPDVYDPGTDVELVVGTGPSLETTVVEGSVPGRYVDPSHDHCIKVDLDGSLESDSTYHYRFGYDGVWSRTGRCRTLPASGDDPESLAVAVVACQDYQNGYYGAYGHIAEADVDFLLHLGDFIYESANGAYTGPEPIPEGRNFELPSGSPLAGSLADFRFLYNTYKSDPLLQAALEAHTLVAGWDDHEIGDNRYWDYAADAPGLPAQGERGTRRALELTADGIQAWVEHVPARVDYDPDAEDLHEAFELYRTVEFGDLAELVVTDQRLFRDGPPCPGTRAPLCFDEDDPDRTMLGERQRAWFETAIAESTATWTVWLNAVLTMPLTVGDGWNQVEFLHDSWDGFQAERRELMRHVRAVAPQNFVTLTGDLHCAMAGYMLSGYGDVDPGGDPERVGVEFLTPALTSLDAATFLDLPGPWDGEALNDLATHENDHLRFVDWYRNGYAVVRFDGEACRYTVYEVETDTNSADAERRRLAQYRVPEGRVELQEEYNVFEENLGSDLL